MSDQRRRQYLEEVAPYAIPAGGIFEPGTGEVTPLQFPPDAAYIYNMFHAEAGEIVCCDING